MSKVYVLVAYPYLKKKLIDTISEFEKCYPNNIEIIIDSGAFTAWKGGKPIKLSVYCNFLDTVPFKNYRAIMLDVIGDPVKTMNNYNIMKENGYDPVPVVTYGEELDVIEYFYENTDIIAAGGLAGKYTKEAISYVDKLMKKVNGRKIHLLGYTSPNIVKYFKPYSCDSSTWEAGARYGRAQIYMGNGAFKTVSRSDFLSANPKLIDKISRLKINYLEAKNKSGWKGGKSFLRKLGGASWVKFSLDCDKHLNVKLFLACASKEGLDIVFENYLRLR